MGLINSSKSWTSQYGRLQKVTPQDIKARKKEIEEEKKRKKQREKDIRRAKRMSVFGPPSAGRAQKFSAKAVKKAEEKRQKKAARKAARKARGFFG